MIKIGDRVKFNSVDGESGEGYVVGHNWYNYIFYSIHVVPERSLHEDTSRTLPGNSFWDVPESKLSLASWKQEDI